MAPRVSVVMAVYNGQQYLKEAIESILIQTFSDFEFIIIDDGSTDSSYEIVKAYRDPRIRLIENGSNHGLAASLNTGFAAATGRYLARMDADDVSLPKRLSQQVAFMDVHPEVGVCGSWVEVIGTDRHLVWEYPTDSDTIHARLLFDSALAHPSVIFNRALLQNAQLSYDSRYRCAQDYELWTRAARRLPLANISEVLLIHRVHPNQVGQREVEMQETWAAKVRRNQLDQIGLSPTDHEFAMHLALSTWTWPATDTFTAESESWLQRLCVANSRSRVYPEPAFSKVVGERWMAVCQSVEPNLGRRFWGSPLSAPVDLGWKQNLRGRVWRGISMLGFDRALSSYW